MSTINSKKATRVARPSLGMAAFVRRRPCSILRITFVSVIGFTLSVSPGFVNAQIETHEIKRALPQATQRFIERSGHYPRVEQPDTFYDLIKSFIAEVQS